LAAGFHNEVVHPASDGGAEISDPGFVDLFWLLEMSHEQYLERFRGTAVRRAKHWMLQRNAAVALGNTGSLDALPRLVSAMTSNNHPLVRGHAAWAVGRLGIRFESPDARRFLEQALDSEEDETVREEIRLALRDLGPARS
jgi:epoxyqueuosine reductase